MAPTVKLSIFRFDPAKDKSYRFQDFDLPHSPGLTMLDAMFYIQDYIDPSLAFRYSCRAGICGSCAMHIDGSYRLACETPSSIALDRRVTIRPLAHMPIVRDLVVDFTNFWKQYRKIMPYLMPGTPPPDKERPQTPAERQKLDTLIDCILCAACHASCPMTGSDEDYIGPAVLTKANRFAVDSRDDALPQRLQVVSDDHGVWRCHTVFNCSLACPKDIDPAGSIGNLKRLATKNFVGRSPTK